MNLSLESPVHYLFKSYPSIWLQLRSSESILGNLMSAQDAVQVSRPLRVQQRESSYPRCSNHSLGQAWLRKHHLLPSDFTTASPGSGHPVGSMLLTGPLSPSLLSVWRPTVRDRVLAKCVQGCCFGTAVSDVADKHGALETATLGQSQGTPYLSPLALGRSRERS